MLGNLLRKRVTLLVIVVIVSIGLLLLAIYKIDKSKQAQVNLRGYDSIKQKMATVSNTTTKDPQYQKMLLKLNALESKNLSREEQYTLLEEAGGALNFAYASTNNHDLYILEKGLVDLIRSNFPEKNFPASEPSCFDPVCAENPQPKEILAVIEEIKKSNVPEGLKDDNIRDLTNFGYLNKKDNYSKAGDYLFVAQDIKNNKDYTSAGLNIKLSDAIIDYVRTTFPEEYKQYLPLP